MCHHRYTQIAVASFGASKLSECGRKPAGFTKLTPALLDWVRSVTEMKIKYNVCFTKLTHPVEDWVKLMIEIEYDICHTKLTPDVVDWVKCVTGMDIDIKYHVDHTCNLASIAIWVG